MRTNSCHYPSLFFYPFISSVLYISRLFSLSFFLNLFFFFLALPLPPLPLSPVLLSFPLLPISCCSIDVLYLSLSKNVWNSSFPCFLSYLSWSQLFFCHSRSWLVQFLPAFAKKGLEFICSACSAAATMRRVPLCKHCSIFWPFNLVRKTINLQITDMSLQFYRLSVEHILWLPATVCNTLLNSVGFPQMRFRKINSHG